MRSPTEKIEVVATIASEDSDIEDMKLAHSALRDLNAIINIKSEKQSKRQYGSNTYLTIWIFFPCSEFDRNREHEMFATVFQFQGYNVCKHHDFYEIYCGVCIELKYHGKTLEDELNGTELTFTKG